MKYSRLLRGTPTVLGLLFIVGTSLHAQLFQNLQALSNRIPVGSGHLTNPGTYRPDGPKWLSAGDFDADGHADIATTHVNGEVSVVWGNGQRQFSAPQVLPSGLTTLRGLVCQDVNSDGKPDLLAAGPTEGKVALWENLGGRTFRAARLISTYAGARNLALGDFNGDSLPDLAVAGPDSPPLPVGGALHGLIQLRGDATGNFTSVGTVPSIGVRPSNPTGFPLRPLYSVTPFRPAGATVDWLAVTHAESRVLWWLKADALGVLMVEGSVELQPLTMEYPGGVRAIVVGSVFQQSGRGDLLTANSQYGSIEVRAEKPAGQPFGWETSPAQTLHVPGGPRSMQLSDLNGDGWLDLVVAVRNADRILVYRNNAGVFELSSESPAGRSPREMAVADFDEDGAMDFAVVNRDSFDISILPGRPPTPDPIVSFGALDQVYPVDGELAALVVKRLNADNKDDVVQLHRASGEVSVRLAGALGQLDPPVIYPMGTMPNGLAVVDYDRDGKLDLVTANLGAGNTTGAACYRRGLGDGTFGALSEIRISTELAALGISATEAGSLYGIEYGDLDGDGIQDAIAGFIDCRILFYKGNANGSFTLVTSPRGLDHIFINFIFEARGFAIADFDQDGDNDIAAIGAYGDLGTIENRGDLLNPNRSGSLVIRKVGMAQASSDVGWGGSSRTLIVRDLNGDGDPDLLAGMARGTVAFLGQAGMLFEVGQLWDATVPPPREFSIPVVNMAVSSMAQADFDNNGSVDLAVACDVARCMEIQVTNGYGGWSRAVRVAVPSAAFLATGDLDGDGKADLVGTGDAELRPHPDPASCDQRDHGRKSQRASHWTQHYRGCRR
jgi:adhesin/invasin